MKRLLFILFLLIPFPVFATSGACSWHSGVNCSVGMDNNGNAFCNDGTSSNVSYISMKECLDVAQCTQAQYNSLLQKYNVPTDRLKIQNDSQQANSIASQIGAIHEQIKNTYDNTVQQAINSGGVVSRSQIALEVYSQNQNLTDQANELSIQLGQLNNTLVIDRENLNQDLYNVNNDCQNLALSDIYDQNQQILNRQSTISEPVSVSTYAPPVETISIQAHQWNFKRTLKLGSRGSDVKDLQTYLGMQGYLTSEPSGVFNRNTRTALKKFQKDNDLKQTGNFDFSTRNFINSL